MAPPRSTSAAPWPLPRSCPWSTSATNAGPLTPPGLHGPLTGPPTGQRTGWAGWSWAPSANAASPTSTP
eukprot:3394508-Lingulodinium_polyedra.AAC.1